MTISFPSSQVTGRWGLDPLWFAHLRAWQLMLTLRRTLAGPVIIASVSLHVSGFLLSSDV